MAPDDEQDLARPVAVDGRVSSRYATGECAVDEPQCAAVVGGLSDARYVLIFDLWDVCGCRCG